MFKTGPFSSKKVKEGSKNIVGRVVEVNGKEIDENLNTNNKFTTSSSVQKSTLSSSVSRLFGASPYKKTSTTRTPGRKLLKKLICTPGKSRSFPGTSVSEIDDFNTYIPNNNSTGVTVSRSTSSEETNSFHTSNFNQMPSSPPRLARKLLQEDNKNKDPMVKTPMKAHNHHISNSINNIRRVDDALVAASNRSSFNEDMIFSTNSDDDDELDHRNEHESNPISRTKFSSPYSSPGQFAMKSPGISIPTPGIMRETSHDGFTNDFSGSNFQFQHPISRMHDSPFDEINATTPNPKNLSTQFEEYEDDAAFLPDDFVVSEPKKDEATFTQEQVERKIREAKREERLSLRKQHEREMEECQNEFEKVMFESGSQWKKDADEQETMYQKLLKEEKHKTKLKHHELINKAQSLEDVKENLKKIEAEREILNLRVKDIETSEEEMRADTNKSLELESLRKDKQDAENLISELKSEFQQAVDPLKREKQIADQKSAELSEQLRVLTESSDQSQNQLEQALRQVALLKGQLAESPSVDPEEILTSKLEVEKLKILRAEDAKEIQELQNQLNQIVDEHQDAFTPQKKGVNNRNFESPCVGEIDMLRVDYDKAQEQLKSMGKILKRYRTERDDLKESIEALEQRHVEAIEIAVKLATQDQKERIRLLNEEYEDLRQQPKDIAEQMVEEMKTHMADLRRTHEEEIVRIRGTLDNQTEQAEEKEKTMRAQFEMEMIELKTNHEKKIESLIQEMHKLRSNQNDELSIVKSSSKEETDVLQVELRQLRIEFENEKIKIIETKSRECEALEGQIKAMSEMHREELELAEVESREKIDGLKEKMNKLEMDFEEKSSGALKQIKSNFENALAEAKAKAKAEEERLLTQINSLKEEKDAETKKSNNFDSQVLEIQSQNATRIEKVREEYDRQIREVKSEHASESEELLAQLDLIEAETAQRFKNREYAMSEKDAVITALGSQLAESESRFAATSKEYEDLKQEIKFLRSDLEVVTTSNEASQKEITTLIERHTKEIEDQIALREGACNQAREQTIALAEAQLAERQEIYQALKRELDNALSKISVLEQDLRFATKELEEMGRRHEAFEADLRDELAQSKAAIATKEANKIRVEKVHQCELDRAREAERAMKSKFKESQATSNSIQKTLAAMVIKEKRLNEELAEVTAISEELATICEKNKLM